MSKKGFDFQLEEFCRKYAGQTVYLRCYPFEVLYNDPSYEKVYEYAGAHPEFGAMIVPVPSREQINEKFGKEEP